MIPASWSTKSDAKEAFDKLNSRAARVDAVKEQICIHVISMVKEWQGVYTRRTVRSFDQKYYYRTGET